MDGQSPDILMNVSKSYFDALDAGLIADRNCNFHQLALDEPLQAYKFIRAAAMRFYESTQVAITHGYRVVVNHSGDGHLASQGMMRQRMEQIFPDPQYQESDVVLSVMRQPRFRDMIRGRQTPPWQVIRFKV